MKTFPKLPSMMGALALAAVPAWSAAQAGAQPQRPAQAPARAAGQPAAAPPNVQAGEQIAAKGTPGGAAACVTCHGAGGEGNPASGFPRIAGQSAYYLHKQLAAYASGARSNPVMTPIAKAMNEQQMRDVSGYYATLGGAGAGPAPSAAGAAKRGEQLAKVGDESIDVQACANCHGPAGAGEAPSYPYLAGQHANYLTASMGEWKSGARKTDPSGQMPRIAKGLSDADVAALSAYFSTQPVPPPASKQVNIAAGSAQRPAVAAAAGAPGPKVPGAPAAGVTGGGTEAGAPVTGGSQGSGGGGGTQGTLPPPPPVKR